MTVTHALYQLLIGPLVLIFEYVFAYAESFFHSVGLSILAMSLVMNVLLLPLYNRADAIQDQERAQQKKLSAWVTHIKKTFSGNERFMMLQTYYRQNGYKPLYALRGSLPLLLEVPFFIAAYRFLSTMPALREASFGPISDLGAPDGLLTLAGVSVNVLPILMTAINLISGAIYTRGLPLKDKLQLYGMALVFLVLLYDSPAGLVVYWTMNNLFSLLKNLFNRLPHKKTVGKWALGLLGAVLLGLGCVVNLTWRRRILVLVLGLGCLLPALLPLVRRSPRTVAEKEKPGYALFFGGCLFLTLLTGLLIPSAVIASSPMEFVYIKAYRSPLVHVLSTLLLSGGLFLAWFGLFYFLAGPGTKRVLTWLVWVGSGVAVVNYMFFGTKLGTLSSELMYEIEPVFSAKEQLLNLGVIAALVAAMSLLWKKKPLLRVAYIALVIAAVGMSGANLVKIHGALPEIHQAVEAYRVELEQGRSARIPLSTKGKNVVVLMMDRAIGSYIPYLFAEKPELEAQFAGFTYYPNTLSYGISTNFCTPNLFGGYEYTPEELNARDQESLAEKHNEAIRVMPVLFADHDFDVTVCDPPYAGYEWIPDLSIYDDYPQIHAYNTEQGQFNDAPVEAQASRMNRIWERNFFLYSLMKSSPYVLQGAVYQHGTYFVSDRSLSSQVMTDLTHSEGTNEAFYNSYSVLKALPEITDITDSDRNTFLMMENGTTHEPMLLQEPDYVPADYVDNTQYDKDHADRFTLDGRTMRMEEPTQVIHYQTNMAALLQLGQWLDYLRENGVYDNTRIIIVADHGKFLKQFDDYLFGTGNFEDIMCFNPLLMVKDFQSQTFTVDRRRMTTADVPTLATADVIAQPRNPFTGKPINSDAKDAAELHVFGSFLFRIDENNGNTFIPGPWYAVRGEDILDRDNWAYLGEG